MRAAAVLRLLVTAQQNIEVIPIGTGDGRGSPDTRTFMREMAVDIFRLDAA